MCSVCCCRSGVVRRMRRPDRRLDFSIFLPPGLSGFEANERCVSRFLVLAFSLWQTFVRCFVPLGRVHALNHTQSLHDGILRPSWRRWSSGTCIRLTPTGSHGAPFSPMSNLISHLFAAPHPQVWKFLLGYFPYESTRGERKALQANKAKEYEVLKAQWQSVSEDQVRAPQYSSLLSCFLASASDSHRLGGKILADSSITASKHLILFEVDSVAGYNPLQDTCNHSSVHVVFTHLLGALRVAPKCCF